MEMQMTMPNLNIPHKTKTSDGKTSISSKIFKHLQERDQDVPFSVRELMEEMDISYTMANRGAFSGFISRLHQEGALKVLKRRKNPSVSARPHAIYEIQDLNVAHCSARPTSGSKVGRVHKKTIEKIIPVPVEVVTTPEVYEKKTVMNHAEIMDAKELVMNHAEMMETFGHTDNPDEFALDESPEVQSETVTEPTPLENIKTICDAVAQDEDSDETLVLLSKSLADFTEKFSLFQQMVSDGRAELEGDLMKIAMSVDKLSNQKPDLTKVSFDELLEALRSNYHAKGA